MYHKCRKQYHKYRNHHKSHKKLSQLSISHLPQMFFLKFTTVGIFRKLWHLPLLISILLSESNCRKILSQRFSQETQIIILCIHNQLDKIMLLCFCMGHNSDKCYNIASIWIINKSGSEYERCALEHGFQFCLVLCFLRHPLTLHTNICCGYW